jgi:hypothetical protein
LENDVNLVSLCVTGLPARRSSSNARKLEALDAVLVHANRLWSDLDAVLLPGGYFAVPGHECFYRSRRRDHLDRHDLIEPLLRARSRLTRSKGAWLVVGVDSPASGRFGGDHLCVAYGPRSRVQIARKIFPSAGQPGYVCNADDFGCPQRVIALPSGPRAILAACYDGFGVADTQQFSTVRRRLIRGIGYDDGRVERSNLRGVKDDCLASHAALITRGNPRVGLFAIHQFPSSRGVTFWQRHGIAASAAALQGSAVGAAHFGEKLPRAPEASTLAAAEVPRRHLTMPDRTRRRAWALAPAASMFISTPIGDALVRLFTR